MTRLILSICVSLSIGSLGFTQVRSIHQWTSHSPREELRPAFSSSKEANPKDSDTLRIASDERNGLMGSWNKVVDVESGKHYRFSVWRKTSGLELVRREAIARLVWLDDQDKRVRRADPVHSSYRPGQRPVAEPEFPPDGKMIDGWTQLTGVYVAPPEATRAKIELHLRWAPANSSVTWTVPSFTAVAPPAQRLVKLATVHYQPKSGKSPEEKREQFAPLIAQAANKGADLVVLPETLTYYGSGGSYSDAAETIPGPSTEYFASLAKQHDLHIVAGLIERDKHLIYNVAVLLGPDGEMIGKYRKVTLPRGEIEGGIMPGNDYPVFDTRFGKVGMMICYDGFFPEVARELSNRGAEVIAWPVWGCNPMLGAARACENHVYVISSTYTDSANDWMISAIYGHDGKPLAKADEWGSIAITEVDLNQPTYWHSLGDFRAQIQRHRPKVNVVP